MAIFAVVAQPNSTSKLPEAIQRLYPDSYLAIQDDVWLLAAPNATAQEVSDKLEVSDGDAGPALVLQISGYYGRASPNIWNWIQAKWE